MINAGKERVAHGLVATTGPYPVFGLVLAINLRCNMRCSYCYVDAKRDDPMPEEYARHAIRRAVATIEPGGLLELSFFGGEPLLEAERVWDCMTFARRAADAAGIRMTTSMTTNGTVRTKRAWAIMTGPGVDMTVSHDGTPAAHDRHRVLPDGSGTSAVVDETLHRLHAAGRRPEVVMVVRPDTVDELAAGVQRHRENGVGRVHISLDLWTKWSRDALTGLRVQIGRAAEIWRAGLPQFSVNWFDEKTAYLAKLPLPKHRCGFGQWELTVVPSGRMYPCERLIGADEPDSPTRLDGHVMDRDDFLNMPTPHCLSSAPAEACDASGTCDSCTGCEIEDMCDMTCQCSNYARTGDTSRPDGLLCAVSQTCLTETARVLAEEKCNV
jgi:uncharacterized protein